MRRGEKEDILNLSFTPPEGDAIQILETLFMKGNGQDSIQVHMSIRDSYKRLLSRSMETELRLITKERADSEAIRVFAENLRQLLLAPPLGPKRVMGIDPGFRTGCKIVCLDRQGQLIHYDTIYPHSSEKPVERLANRFYPCVTVLISRQLPSEMVLPEEKRNPLLKISPSPVIFMFSWLTKAVHRYIQHRWSHAKSFRIVT